jgi:hypothetical protein
VQIARFVGNAFSLGRVSWGLKLLIAPRCRAGHPAGSPWRRRPDRTSSRRLWSENSAGGRRRAEDLIISSLAVSIPAQEKGPGELGQLRGKDQDQPMRFVLFWLKSGAGGSGGLSGREDRKCAAKHDNSQQAENQAAIAFGLGR